LPLACDGIRVNAFSKMCVKETVSVRGRDRERHRDTETQRHRDVAGRVSGFIDQNRHHT
jgi:hypothetical protein